MVDWNYVRFIFGFDEKLEKRKEIHLRNEAYYKKLLDNFKEDSYITLTSLDVSKRLGELEEQLAKNLE